jgi:hypothetical protein
MDKFLGTFDKPKLVKENINLLNQSIISKRISQQIKILDPMDLLPNSTRPAKK